MKLKCLLLGHYWLFSMLRTSDYICYRCGKEKNTKDSPFKQHVKAKRQKEKMTET